MAASPSWSIAPTEALKEYVASAEISYSQIAKKINKRFGTAYSRNAVIGKSGRLGLSNPFKTKSISEPKKRSRTVFKIVRANGNSTALRIYRTVKTDAPDLRCVEAPHLLVTLDQRSDDGCCYIPPAQTNLYCGNPRKPDSSYCWACHSIIYVPPHRPKAWSNAA